MRRVGVYAIWIRASDNDDWDVRYIGKASKTRERVNGHFKSRNTVPTHKRTPAHIRIREVQADGLQLGVIAVEIQNKSLYSYVESSLIEKVRNAGEHQLWNKHA